jgi:hypothetical protein
MSIPFGRQGRVNEPGRKKRRILWISVFWFVLFGLTIWSYGFNNIPFVRPVPLVDALVPLVVLWSLPLWWRFRKIPAVRKLLCWVAFLSLVVMLRLVVDVPRYGVLAGRDALFASEIWVIFPAVAAGYLLEDRDLDRRLLWLFSLATAWFLLYPLRDPLTAISPMVGVQRPVPLFAWTTAGFVAVPAFFWFFQDRNLLRTWLGGAACLLVLLFVQSRGAYLSFILSIVAMLLIHPSTLPRWGKVGVTALLAFLVLSLLPPLPGRVGAPVGMESVLAQLRTLLGEEGAGAGSFHHRAEVWPLVVSRVLDEPLGWLVGLGLGPDLFLGFTISGGVLVRKPHNDFLELWARTGVLGLTAWVGLLATMGLTALRGARRGSRHHWILALQIAMAITSFAQPALGFAYTSVVWAGLTGLWLGAQIREQKACAHSSRPQPLSPARW